MAGYQQQDAHEFFCFILEMMSATAGPGAGTPSGMHALCPARALAVCMRSSGRHEWCRRERRSAEGSGGTPTGAGVQCSSAMPHALAAAAAHPPVTASCPSPLLPTPDCITRSVFGGALRSDVICAACGHVSTSHEQFSHLSLDIPPPQQVGSTRRKRGGQGSQGSVQTGKQAA